MESDSKKNLTTITVTGSPTFKEIMASLKSFYEGTPTKNVLWNFTEAPIWEITSEEVEKLASFAPRFSESRQCAKTAIVAPDELTKALSQLFVLFGYKKESPIKVELFQTIEEGLDWIFLNNSI